MSEKHDSEPASEQELVPSDFGKEATAVTKRGRPSNRDRNIEAVASGESRIVDRYDEMVESALEIALGRKPEICPYHHEVLRCPHIRTEMRPVIEEGIHVLPEDVEMEEVEVPCKHLSQARNGDASMLKYLIDRVAGRAPTAGEKQVKLEFVRKVANHVGVLFQEVNGLVDHDERAQAFAAGMVRMWTVLSEE